MLQWEWITGYVKFMYESFQVTRVINKEYSQSETRKA